MMPDLCHVKKIENILHGMSILRMIEASSKSVTDRRAQLFLSNKLAPRLARMELLCTNAKTTN